MNDLGLESKLKKKPLLKKLYFQYFTEEARTPQFGKNNDLANLKYPIKYFSRT